MRLFVLLPALLGIVYASIAQAELPDLVTFMILPGQVTQAAVVLNADGHTALQITLTEEKRIDFREFTERNLDKQVKIDVNGRVLLRPVIKARISSGSLELPISSPEAGLAIARTLTTK